MCQRKKGVFVLKSISGFWHPQGSPPASAHFQAFEAGGCVLKIVVQWAQRLWDDAVDSNNSPNNIPRDRPVDHKPGDRTGPSPDRPENAEDFQCPLVFKKNILPAKPILFSFFQLLCVLGVGSGEHIFLIMRNKSCIVPTPKSNIFQALFIFGGWIRGAHLSEIQPPN